VNLATISFALVRIYKTIWKISELRVNRVLMLLHLGMFLAFAVLFLIEYAVYFNLAFTKAIVENNIEFLSILFILKQTFGLAIYLLLLFMLIKIVSPLSYVTLKMDQDLYSESEQAEDQGLARMLNNIRIPMFLLQQNKVVFGELIQKYSDCE
jgi:hypothetical protein